MLDTVSADCDDEISSQPTLEVIDDLCFTIQRQSAACMELVREAVSIEREQCARAAEAVAESLAGQDRSAWLAACRIAEQIRARSEETLAVAGAPF
jgi:hypothetical protein